MKHDCVDGAVSLGLFLGCEVHWLKAAGIAVGGVS